MKPATAKKSARSKATASKPRSRTAKTAAAAIGPAAASLVAVVGPAFDEGDTVVAEALPLETHELSDAAYVEQLLAAATPPSEAAPDASVAPPIAIAVPAEQVNEVAQPVVCEQPVVEVEVMNSSTVEPQPTAIETSVVVLPSQCLLRDTVQLKASLLPHVDHQAAVSIDTRDVERVDTAAMQVLLAFVHDRHRRQRAVNWLGLNEAFVDAAQLLGIEKMLGLPASAAVA